MIRAMDVFGQYQTWRYDWVNPNEDKTPEEYPYSFSAYYIFKSPAHVMKGATSIYTDRLQLWFNSELVREAMKDFSSWGSIPNGNQKKTCQNAIDVLYGKGKYEVVAFARECNVGNGYPLGIFFMKEMK